MSPNKATVQRYMDAFAKRDHVAVLSCLADDVEWNVPGAFHITGKEAFVGSPTIAVTRLTEERDVVVAEDTVRSARKEGGVLNAAFCDVFVMQDAKIRHITSYLMETKA